MATEKQIFAAVEAADHEIRLIVGEFFNTRFNIIKVERVPVSGISYDKVTDPEAVTKAVRTAAENAKKMISAEVQRVILAIPSFRAKRYSFKSTVDVEGIDGVVTIQDVRKRNQESGIDGYRPRVCAGADGMCQIYRQRDLHQKNSAGRKMFAAYGRYRPVMRGQTACL